MTGTQCLRCHATLAAGLEGLCPRCLLQAALNEPLAAEEQIGPFRIIRLIGEGGMGAVYLAEQDEPIHRTVALKIIKLGMDTREVIARFDTERQALALMEHPNIARVYEAGANARGRPYFVMEYVHGVPITEYCDRKRLTIRQRLELFIQICHGVQHAHQKGIIHRDLKPSNVLVTETDGRPVPKIIDFGLARALERRLGEHTLFTELGVLVGTPEYMSPEQAAGGERLDTRTDVYALGMLLYELLTGALPFGDGKFRHMPLDEICRVIRKEEPLAPSRRLASLGGVAEKIAERRKTELRTLRRRLRGEMEWITLKALEKEPARRYGSVAEFCSDVLCHLHDEPVSAGPQRPGYRLRKFLRRHWTLTAATIVGVACLTVAAFVSTMLYLRAEQARITAVRHEYATVISAAALDIRAADPTGARRRLLSCPPSLRGWEWRHLMYRTDPSVRALKASGSFPHSPYASGFAFRGDGTVVWHSETSVEEWSAEGAHTSHAGLNDVLALDDDGLRAVSRGADGRLNVYGLVPFQMIAVLDAGSRIIHSAAFEPGGDRLAGGSEDGWLQVWEISTRRRQFQIPAHADRITCVHFTRDGRSIGTAARDNRIRLWDAASGALRATLAGAPFAWVFDFNADAGWIVYPVREGRGGALDSQVRLQETATGKLLHSYPAPADVTAIAFNPTLFGRQYAFVSGDGELQLCDEASGCTILRRETHERLNSVAFSPDGTLVYSGAESGELRAWDTQTRGGTYIATGAEVRALAPLPPGEFIVASGPEFTSFISVLPDREFAWPRVWTIDQVKITAVAASGDGSRIAGGFDDHLVRMWTKNGHLLQTLTGHTGPITALAFSPDGSLLASAAADSTARLAEVASGRQIAVLPHSDPVNAVRFSPDGTLLATASGTAVWLWDARGHRMVRSFSLAPAAATAVTFNPDGRHILAGGADGAIRVWDVRSGREMARMTGHQSSVLSIAFSTDGLRLASGSADQTVRIWDAHAYEPLLVLTGTKGAVHSVLFSSDGGRLISSDAGPIRLWETGR